MTYKRSVFPEGGYDVFKEKYDVPPDKQPLADEYYVLWKKGADKTEQEEIRFNELTVQLEPYLYTAEHINHYQDAMTNVQKFFVENTQGYVNGLKTETRQYVDNKQNEMNIYVDNKKVELDAEINKFEYRGVYNPTIQYFQRNTVDFNDGSGSQVYLCIKDSLGNEPTNVTYWKKLTIQGARGKEGQDGVGLKFKGEYKSNISYSKDDGVQFGGVLFASLIDGNVDNTPDLTQDTPYWAKALDVTVTVRKMIGVRNLATQTSNVNFMTGEITSFNPVVDSLSVYQNSVRLTKGVDYNINANNQSIDKINGIWEGNSEQPIFFEFEVTKNIVNDLVFSDGSAIQDGTISKSKLTTDVQAEINKVSDNADKISILNTKVSPETPLNTTSQDLSNAINEINSKAGKIGTKEVDETDIKDNYTVRYDGKTDKIVWVRSEIDRTPPAPVTNIKVKEDNTKVIITYTTPSDDDYMGTRLVYKTGSYPTGINDGTVIGNYISGTEITGLTNDITYYFRLFPYDTSNNYNTDTSQQITAIPTEQRIYGVVIDESNSNPETSVTYTDDAVGFTPMRGSAGNFQWGSWQQIFKDMNIRPCLFKNGQVNYYINPNDYTKKLDGTSADITTGNDGDVMVEYPIIYWKMWKVGDKQYVQYSEKPFEGARCPAHTVGTVVKDKIYLPAYMGYTLGGKLRSLSGKKPTVDQTIGTFRAQAQANGTGYQQFPYYGLLMLQVLGIVWFKSRDSQTALGRGYVDGNSASITTGGTNTKGMFYGETTGRQQNKFAGIEDFWGNTFYWIDGFYSDSNRNMMISNQDVFNDNGSGYKNYGQGATANVSGYIDTVQGGTETGFVAKTSRGSSTTHYCDYGNLSGGSLPHFGGYWSSGSNAGAFQLDVSSSASNSPSTLAARLAYLG